MPGTEFSSNHFPMLAEVAIPSFYGVTLRRETMAPCRNTEAKIYSIIADSPHITRLPAGSSVAIAIGSRGIADLPLMAKTLVSALEKRGLKPFVVPAMGSHGGANAEGQTALLAALGITAESTGAKIISSMETVNLGEVAEGVECHMDKNAMGADATIILARVKEHTNFVSDIESGMCKMLAVGMGKATGAKNAHIYGRKGLVDYIPMIANRMLEKGNVALAIAVVENADSRICHIEGVEPADIIDADRRLLRLAKSCKGRLPFAQLDLLVLETIGKDISGTGMDAKLVGRPGFGLPYGNPQINAIAVLGISEASHGNGIGIGIADVTTTRALNSLDLSAMYINALTSCCMDRVKLPPGFASEREAIQAGLKICWQPQARRVRAVIARSTRDIDKLLLTEPLMAELQKSYTPEKMQIWRECQPLNFSNGNLKIDWPSDNKIT